MSPRVLKLTFVSGKPENALSTILSKSNEGVGDG